MMTQRLIQRQQRVRRGSRAWTGPGFLRGSRPIAWRGREFALRAGLWRPGMKQHLGRLAGLDGQADRTVLVGRLSTAADGRTRFVPSDAVLPGSAGELGGAEFAVICAGVRHDFIDQPHSLKLMLRYLLPEAYDSRLRPFLHVVDAISGEERASLREEREDDELSAYMAGRGLALRDDRILVQPRAAAYFHAEMAQRFRRGSPVLIESEHYGGSVQRGCRGDGSGFFQAIEDYHASYASIHWWPHGFLDKNRDLVRRINSRIGYRFQLAEMAWISAVRRGEKPAVKWAWRNGGVAP